MSQNSAKYWLGKKRDMKRDELGKFLKQDKYGRL